MPPAFTAVLSQHFYVRLVWNATTIDFMPAVTLIKPQVQRIGSQQVTLNGTLETQVERLEYRVALGWAFMEGSYVNSLRQYVEQWGLYGKNATLTLDRLSTSSGQLEYDWVNTTFTRAQLLNNPFETTRSVLGRGGLYQVELLFRQGTA